MSSESRASSRSKAARSTDVALRVAVETCTYCKQKIPLNERTVDHEPPRFTMRGVPGFHHYRRLMACFPCNGLKGNRTEAQFRTWLETRAGRAWLALRADEVTAGRVSAKRAEVPGAPVIPNTRRKAVATKRAKRAMVRLYKSAERDGWTADEIRRRWPPPINGVNGWRDRSGS